MQRFFIALFFIAAYAHTEDAIAQTAAVSGNVSVAATVSLLNVSDSSWIKSDVTDDKGNFLLTGIAYGKYIIAATSVGYKTGMLAIDVKDSDMHKYTIELQKENTTLGEIAVTAKKPFIEMSMGKTVVNVESTVTGAGTTALDLMRRLPGLSVSQDGTISMNGKQGVMVLVDDRPTYLAGTELAEYLKTIMAGETGQIELITQPGAKYDAAGNTGVINIKLKKNKKQGWNGSVAASYGETIYFRRDENLLLNYRAKKLSLSLSGNDMEAIGFADWTEQLYFTDPANGKVTGTSEVHSTPKERFSNSVLRLTADYELTDKIRIGASIRGTYHPNASTDNSFVANTDAITSNRTYNNIVSPDGHIRKNVTTNAYLSYKISKESSLDINLDYLDFNKHAHQELTNTAYNDIMQLQPDPLFNRNTLLSVVNVYSVKADYNCVLKDGWKIEAGIKSSSTGTDNNALFSLYDKNIGWINDTGKTNRFVYTERINAAYSTLSRKLSSKWEAHIGLRAEQTIAEGIQYVHNDSFTKNYLDLFPTAYITYTADSSNSFELNYGRRIDRPSYNLLNPFAYYSFQYNYQKGNPRLLPQYTNDIELKHSYRNMIISTLSVSRSRNVFSDLIEADSATKIIYNTSANFASNSSISYNISFNKELYKWWSLNTGGSVYYFALKGMIGSRQHEVDWAGCSVNMSSRFSFGKDWKLEASAYYSSGGWSAVNSAYDGNVYMEFGVSKKVSRKLLINLFTADPFYSYRMGSRLYGYDFRADTKFRYASRIFSVSATWSFGSGQSASRKDNAIDEAGRIK